jgi:tRNA threonylcarbamoyladenosine dehydratase
MNSSPEQQKCQYPKMLEFDYGEAFKRNIGFLSYDEQEILKNSRIAIAGLGGTGGAQVHAFSRMGIGAFHLADPDTFELANFNRQTGATMDTIGHRKSDIALAIVKGINPSADVELFHDGISSENIDSFLEGVDIVVDSLDFYCFKERFLLYKAARERGLWVLTAPPLGFGFTLILFDPRGMKFEDYFDFSEDTAEQELVVSLVVGIAPHAFFMKYLDFEGLNVGGGRLPSVGAAPMMIAGVMATEIVNLLTKKRLPQAAPYVFQFDALLHKYRCRKYRWGMRSPIQKLKKLVLRKRLNQM